MDTLRTVELYRDDNRKVIAIESVDFSHAKSENGCQLYGALAPIAIVVCTSEGNEVLIAVEDDTNLETLKYTYPELDDLITDVC